MLNAKNLLTENSKLYDKGMLKEMSHNMDWDILDMNG
jgi:hypothetical protein